MKADKQKMSDNVDLVRGLSTIVKSLYHTLFIDGPSFEQGEVFDNLVLVDSSLKTLRLSIQDYIDPDLDKQIEHEEVLA